MLPEIQTELPMKNEFDYVIRAAVEKHLPGYDWRLFKAQLWEESKFDPLAKSDVGALGIAQFMPGTWKEWSKKAGWPGFDATHPEASIFTGACYMSYLIGQWSWPRPELDRNCLAMASYNSGLGDILDAQKAADSASGYREIMAKLPQVEPKHAPETIRYVKRILGYYTQEITG